MIEIKGNLWDAEVDFVCVTTNGIVGAQGLVMGAGTALQAKQRHPKLPKIWGEKVRRYGNIVNFHIPQGDYNYYGLLSFPTKNDWKNKSDIDLIVRSAAQIKNLVDFEHLYGLSRVKVGLTRPGCGCGGLEWNYVGPILEEIFDTDNYIVYY